MKNVVQRIAQEFWNIKKGVFPVGNTLKMNNKQESELSVYSAATVNGHTEATLRVAYSDLSGNSNNLNSKPEANLSVLNTQKVQGLDPTTQLTVYNSSLLGGKSENLLSVANSAKLGNKLEADLSVATAANAILAYGKTENNLTVAYSANTGKMDGKTQIQLDVNSAVLIKSANGTYTYDQIKSALAAEEYDRKNAIGDMATIPTGIDKTSLSRAIISLDTNTKAVATDLLTNYYPKSSIDIKVSDIIAGTVNKANMLSIGRIISVSGDITGGITFDGSANVSIVSTLSNSGVTSGTYKSVTVDSKGRITAATNPTTLSGYGITDAINLSEKGIANGIATLDSAGLIPSTQLPSYVDDILEYVTIGGFPTTGESGKIYVDKTTNKTYRWSGSVYVYITSGAVDSVSGKTGVVTLVKNDVGLNNVDNTADINKPVSTATQTALNAKANIANTLSGYGITDAYTKSMSDNTFLSLSAGGTLLAGAEIILNADPISQMGVPTKQYVDTTAGFQVKTPVVVASTTNISNLKGFLNIDNVTLTTGDRVLVKDQSTPSQNGIYVVNNSNNNWSRATDMDSTTDCNNASVFVNGGSTHAGEIWIQTMKNVNVGNNSIIFQQFSGTLSYTGIDGIILTGQTFSLDTTFATAGTYGMVTIDSTGRVSGGTTPTTLLGYGIADAINVSQKGSSNGVASLDANGIIYNSQLPTFVTSVAGKSGIVTLTKNDVGLDNVSNTTDITKNVLSATKLTTTRTINGVNFDGTADIVITDNTKVNNSSIGTINGIAPLNDIGIIADTYIHMVSEFSNIASFPATGTNNTIYGDTSTMLAYVWDGTAYAQLQTLSSIPTAIATISNRIILKVLYGLN